MFNRISTLATAAVLVVSLSAPVFAQDSSSAMSPHTAMKHDHSMTHESPMSHGSMSHGSMSHGSMSHGSMHHEGMKHKAKTPGAR